MNRAVQRFAFGLFVVVVVPLGIASLCSGCGGGIATRSAGNINIQAKAGNDVVIKLDGTKATQAAEKQQSISAQADAKVDRTAVGGNDAKVDATDKPAATVANPATVEAPPPETTTEPAE